MFRGLAIVLMVAANYLAGVRIVPAWLKHAPDVGFTLIDVIAPMFIFAIGLTCRVSFLRRRAREGTGGAVSHHVRRYLAIAGIGAIISAGEDLFGLSESVQAWGVLQAIGLSGLAVLPLLLLAWPWRLLAALLLLAGYQLLLDRFWLAIVLSSSHGGLPGTLGWAGMLCLATVLADCIGSPEAPAWRGAVGALGVLLAGLLVGLWVPVSKNRVSSSYVLLSTGASALAYVLVRLAADRAGWRCRALERWGANPLLLYVLHYLLLALVVLPGRAPWYAEASWWLACLQLAFMLVALGLVARALARRGALIRL